jgi:hypothetical protein
MQALNKLFEESILIWRLTDLLSALMYLTIALTLVEISDLHVLVILAIGYVPCVLLLVVLEKTSLWNPVLIDVRSRQYREAGKKSNP